MHARVLAVHTLSEAQRALVEVGEPTGHGHDLARQALHRVVKLDGTDASIGEAVAQEIDRAGGAVAGTPETALLMATRRQFDIACQALRRRGLASAAGTIEAAIAGFDGGSGILRAGRHTLDTARRAYVVGILNATPDSFYDRGRFFGTDRGADRAAAMIEEGADVIEVGGESAVPGAPLTVDEEIRRVAPLVEHITAMAEVPVAVETYKPAVARAAIEAGAAIVNDISGLADRQLAVVCAETGAALVVMHMRDRPKGDYGKRAYRSILDEVVDFLRDRTALAVAAGLPADRIVVDPGLGFTNTTLADLEIMHRFAELRSLGYPILLATSRKDYLEEVLNLPPAELLEATAAAVAYGVGQGARLVRVHDPAAIARVVRVTQAVGLHDYWNGRIAD